MHVLVVGVPALSRLGMWFDLDRERSIASWFASSQLLAAALLFGVMASGCREDRSLRRLLGVLAVALAFVSADEAAQIHERIGDAMGQRDYLPGFPGGRGGWIYLYGAATALGALALSRSLARFIRHFPGPATLLGVGLASIFGGGVAAEIALYHGLWTGESQVLTEETLELAGGALILASGLSLAAAREA